MKLPTLKSIKQKRRATLKKERVKEIKYLLKQLEREDKIYINNTVVARWLRLKGYKIHNITQKLGLMGCNIQKVYLQVSLPDRKKLP